MLTIGFVQPNYRQGPKEFNAHYLPYSAGILWSYVNQFPEINQNYKLEELIWCREDINVVAERLLKLDVVAFSTYVWNKNYNYELAKLLKRKKPEILTIFGGPEIPITDKEIFKKYPFMNVVIKGEGEITLKNLLIAIKDATPCKGIKGLLYIDHFGKLIDTGDADRIQNLDQIPSPYLTGVFDKIMADNPDVEWNVTIETNRGCPYACTFCDWGSLTYNKVKKFDIQRVFDELEWAGQKGAGFVTITDANFGIFVERDDAIADKLIEVQTKYGKPASFAMTWAKDQKKEVFDIVFKLIKSPKFNQGLTVSVQSMSLDVLENIKRKNLAQHNIEHIFALCDKHNVPAYTELILGLPGETKESWKEGIYKVIRAGNHTGMNLLQAQLLENAEMNLLQKKLYKLTSVPVWDYMSGSYAVDEIEESVDVVTSTKDMSKTDMLDSLMFNWFIQTFHINGLTTYISRFINKKLGIDYSEFYDKLDTFLKQDEWFENERKEVYGYYSNWMTQGRINHPSIYGIEVHGWNVSHRTTLNMHGMRKYEHLFDLIDRFVRETFDLEPKQLEQLLKFQRNYVIDYEQLEKFPFIYEYDYDFLGYLVDNEELNKPAKYNYEFNERKDITLARFLENIYFGRKRNFGKAQITKS